MRKTKMEKGITLIALIITIIVLLILAVVAIKAVQGDGIIQYAQNATNSFNYAQTTEQAMVDSLISQIEENAGGDTGPSITWTYTDKDSSGDITIGDLVTTASNNEKFYVIGFEGDDDDETVILLAEKCVDTREQIEGETNPNYNKQNESYNTVAFDETTNEYAHASIKELVETYVIETLGLEANKGRLMSKDEADELDIAILYGTETKWNYWLGSPSEYGTEYAWYVYGDDSDVATYDVYDGSYCGLRPVIEILKSNIS